MGILKFVKNSWKEIFFLLAILVFTLLIFKTLLDHDIISGNLYDNLFGGVVSAGFVGFIVSVVVILIQEQSNLLAKKQSARVFYETRFLPDIRELFSRNMSEWNLDGGKKFYFDNSYANSIYDLYEKYSEGIFDYHKQFPSNRKVGSVKLIYEKTRMGYVLGEKLDQLISEVIRLELAPKNILEHMDIFYLRYMKAKLFTNKPLEWIAAHTADSINSYYVDIYTKLSHDTRIVSMRRGIFEIKEDIEDEIARLKTYVIAET